jgi:threonine dehydrogenase-like Zn-dependent dehydrogenase
VAAPARLVHALADGVSAEAGALVEPAAVVLRGLGLASPHPGVRALVVGDGTVGLLAVRLLQLWSPESVTVLGRRLEQAPLVTAAGADRFETDRAAVGAGYDLVVEAAGAAEAVTAALASCARGATVVLFGFPGQGVSVPVGVDDVVNGDLRIFGSFSYTSAAWAQTVRLLNAGRLDLDFLVTHRFALEAWPEALATLRGEPLRGRPSQGDARTAVVARGKVVLDLASGA